MSAIKTLSLPPVALLLLLGVLLVFPFVLSNYLLFQVTMVMIYGIALLGLNLLTGYSGQTSIGHGAFFAIGAYTAAILIDQFGVQYGLTLVAAGAVCFVCGFGFGLPALRLEGHYLALATFALGVCTPQLLKFKGVEKWTGGVQGISLVKPDAPAGIALNPDQWLYLVSLVLALIMYIAARNVVRGPIGRALTAIRDHPVAAITMGVDVAHFKTLAFAISALYAGVAGALSAIAIQFVSPDSFAILLSVSLLVGIVVGGLGTLSGALWGALFIQFIPNVADKISKSAPWTVYGVVLIVCMLVLPGGIAQLVSRIGDRFKKFKSGNAA